jgi:electron transfer flavoprotein beta subunit
LPAIVTVKEGLNLPRYPSVPAKLRANRKPVDAKPVERPASQLEKLRLVVPAGQGKQAEILGHGPDAAPAVVEVMLKLGVA